MRRLLIIAAFLLLVGAIIWLHLWFSVSPQARIARPYVQKFEREIRKDARFAKIEVGVWELGSKGPLYVRGAVTSEIDAGELRRKFDALGCPVGVSWQVAVVTSQTGNTESPDSDVALQQKLSGRWRADARLPGDIHVQSDTIIDSAGGYVLHLTNTLADGVRTTTLAGTLLVKDGVLIETITNDFGGNTPVPRIETVARITRLDDRELTIRTTNNDKTFTYQKVIK